MSGKATTASKFTINDIPDLKGRVALVTGGNAGLGYTTVLELARHGAKVYMASRTSFAADAAIASLKAAIPAAQVGFLVLDLASLRVAKATADEFLERDAPGYTGFERGGGAALREGGWWWQMAYGELSADEIELQACNGTGHFALALPLLRHRIFAEHARPRRHPLERGERPDFSNLTGLNQTCSTVMNRYGNSKLSARGTRMRPGVAGRAAVFFGRHILFTNELQRRLAGTGIYCLSVHPGLVATTTNIYRGARSAQRSLDLRPTLPPPAGTYASYPWFARFSFLEKYVFVEEMDLRAAYLTPFVQVTHENTLGNVIFLRRPAPYAPLRRLLTNLQRAIILTRLLEHRPDRIGFDAQDKPHATPPSRCRGRVCEALPDRGRAHIIDGNVEPGGMHTLASVFYIDTNHMYPKERYTMERGVVPAR
ncbi:hypothetical protein B0H14DRAFT_3878255 [Mycena olivaceomarginata]|nr:hypothetical protein B0H14DRAFT_3878255 [Mycena olivaceomarginata]